MMSKLNVIVRDNFSMIHLIKVLYFFCALFSPLMSHFFHHSYGWIGPSNGHNNELGEKFFCSVKMQQKIENGK